MYERESTRQDVADGWMMTCVTVRSDEQFLTSPWLRALQRVLELSFSDLPHGRSWKAKLANCNDVQAAEETQQTFMETVLHASTSLAGEFSKAAAEQRSSLNASAIEAAVNLLDSTKFLYSYIPTTRTRNSNGDWDFPENEGFIGAYEAAVERFIHQTNNCEALAVVLRNSGDITQIMKLLKLVSVLKQKRELPTLPWLLECACGGMETFASKSSSLPNRGSLRDVVEEIMRLNEPDYVPRGAVTSNSTNMLPVETWKKISMIWFNSDKLKLRRAGLEQLGEVCKHLILNCGENKASITEWLRMANVFEITFIDRFDERVIPCVEELLLQIEMDQLYIDMLLKRAGSKAVQKVLGNVCHHSSFSEATSSRLLTGATRMLLLESDMDAASLLLAALSESKQTRLNLVRKGKRCALAVVRALVAVLVVACRGENEVQETETSDALHSVCQEMEAKGFKRYVIDLLVSTLLPSESFLPESVRSRMDDVDSTFGMQTFEVPGAEESTLFPSLVRSDINREAVYRALRRLLSSYPLSGGGYSMGYGQHQYQEYYSRSACLRSIEEEWGFRDLFFSDLDANCKTENALWPRLDLLGFFLRFSPAPSDLSYGDLVKVWDKARSLKSQETFCFWLTSCAARDCNPCISTECLRAVLEGLFTKEELRKGGDRTYLCMQTLFLEVNCSFVLLDAEQNHEEGSREHRQSHPPADKAGVKLIGRRLSVLHSDGRMQQGVVTGYKDTWGKHVVEYFTGTVEEKPMDELNEWWLLPAPDKTKAGSVKVKSVRKGDPLIGMENIWIMALESENDSVADRAADLLVALHRRSMSEAFINRTYEELKEAHTALSPHNAGVVTSANVAPEERVGKMQIEEEGIEEVDFNRTAIRCIELLRSLDICTRSGLASSSQRIQSHGHRGRGLPVRVIVDMNHPPPVVATGPMSEIATASSSVPTVSSTTFDFQSNTYVDEFVQRICSFASATVADGCQVSIDPQSELFFGGLGVPTMADEPGADSCTIEEIGVLPGSVATRATLGSKNSSVTTAFGPSNRKADYANSLAIVPYDFDASTLSPPRSISNTPPMVVSPEFSYSGSQSPSPQPSTPTTKDPPLLSVRERAPSPQTVVNGGGADASAGSASAFGFAGGINSKNIVAWSYPEEQYSILFSLLESHASAELKMLIWEFLQSIPTCAADEEMTVSVETACCDSYWRTLYRFQIICARYRMLSASELPDLLEMSTLVEQLLTVTLSNLKQAEIALPFVTGVLLWAVQLASSAPTFPADFASAQISSLLLTLSSALHVMTGRRGQQQQHECSKLRRMPPQARLCDECLRVRRLIRSSAEALESLKMTLRAGGDMLWKSFFSSPLAQELVWKLLVTHPILTIRDAMTRALAGVSSHELVRTLIACERRLEDEEHTSTCEQFFELLTERIGDTSQELTGEMFARISQLVFNWRARRNSPVEEAFPDTTLFACFVRLLTRLVPSSSPQGIDGLIESCFQTFLLNTKDIGIVQNEQARSAISAFVGALVRLAIASSSSHLAVQSVDRFLAVTPVPMKRQDRGWGFEVDWSVDPSSADGSGLRLRNVNVSKCGLLNRGSTCYVNSVLQMLFSVDPFREAILQAKVTPRKENIAKTTDTAASSKTRSASPPPPPVTRQKQSVAKAWKCWCTGVNDLTATQCRICEMPRPEDYELVSESFSFAVPSELMMQVQQAEHEEEEQLAQFQRSTSNGSTASGGPKEEHTVEILRQMQRAFAFLYYGRQAWYDPYKLIIASKPLNLQFPVTSQNDASEYYDKLLDALDQGLRKEGNELAAETLKTCFLGKQVKMKRCQVCEHVSLSKDEEFYRLELMVKNESETKNDLKECLEAFTAPEEMFGDNKVDCDLCQTRTNTTFVTCLTQVPKFLFIHPKRFTYDLESNQTVKLNHFIAFPEQLDLFPFTKDGIVFSASSSSSPSPTAAAKIAENVDEMVVSRPPSTAPFAFGGPAEFKHDHLWYDLKGVLVHRGRAGGGHYYALIDEGDSKQQKRRWVHFNDDRVSAFEFSKLAEECFGGKIERSSTDSWGISRTETMDNEKSAFMLLYIKREEDQEDGKDVSMAKSTPSPEPGVTTTTTTTADDEGDAVMDLSDSDMFFSSSQGGESLYKDKSLTSIVEDDELEIEEENEDDLGSKKRNVSSVPKPIAAFSKMSSIESSALSRAKQLQQNILRMIEPSPSPSPDLNSIVVLRREVEETSLAVIRQALLFSPVTQQLMLDVLSEADLIGDAAVGDAPNSRSADLLVPAFRFFFQVVAKSKSANDDTIKKWITRCLHPIMAGTSFELRTAFADSFLSSWIDAPELTTLDVEIGPPMGSAAFSLVETLLDCPEKRVRTCYLDGACVVLRYASQVSTQTLLSATLKRFDVRFAEQQTASKQKAYLEALLGLLDRIASAGGSGIAGKQLVLECDGLNVVVKAMVASTHGPLNALPSIDLVQACCNFIAGFLRPSLTAGSSHALSCLRMPALQAVLLDVGLASSVVPESVLQVLVEHVKVICDSPTAEFDFEYLVNRLLELIQAESTATSSSMSELPYDGTIVTNVLGGFSSKSSFLSKALLIAGAMRGDLFEFAILRIISAAHGSVVTAQVRDVLEKGGAQVQATLPKHSTWEEKLFPVDATHLRYACRLVSCIVQSIYPGASSSCAISLKEILASSQEWHTLIYWFLAASSQWNQMMYINGLDTDAARRLRQDVLRFNRDGLNGGRNAEQQAWTLIGSLPEEICFQVEGCGVPAVNGMYHHQLPNIQGYPRWMSETGLSIYRCALSNGTEEWFISKLEPGLHPSDEHNVDFYSTSPIPKTCQARVPHPAEWNTLAKGRPPAPMVRKVLVRDLPPPPPPLEAKTSAVEEEEVAEMLDRTVVREEDDDTFVMNALSNHGVIPLAAETPPAPSNLENGGEEMKGKFD